MVVVHCRDPIAVRQLVTSSRRHLAYGGFRGEDGPESLKEFPERRAFTVDELVDQLERSVTIDNVNYPH